MTWLLEPRHSQAPLPKDAIREAVVCAGNPGLNALGIVRSLGRRGVAVHVVVLQSSEQLESRSRYCASTTIVGHPNELFSVLQALGLSHSVPPVLFVDNDEMMCHLAPHAQSLARLFKCVDPI